MRISLFFIFQFILDLFSLHLFFYALPLLSPNTRPCPIKCATLKASGISALLFVKLINFSASFLSNPII